MLPSLLTLDLMSIHILLQESVLYSIKVLVTKVRLISFRTIPGLWETMDGRLRHGPHVGIRRGRLIRSVLSVLNNTHILLNGLARKGLNRSKTISRILDNMKSR